jgi:ATP-dependent Clp protease ATP-binding subunit ClpC
VDLLLLELGRRLAGHDLAIEVTPAARSLIAREGTDPAYGARPLKRTIQRLVENPLARALLRGEFKSGAVIRVDADPVGGTLLFTQEGATVVAEASERRDARAEGHVAAGPGPSSILDLPPMEPSSKPERGGDGELLN